MKKAIGICLVTWVVAMASVREARAEVEYVEMWVAEAEPLPGRTEWEHLGGPFATLKEASDCCTRWDVQYTKSYPNHTRLTRERRVFIRLAAPPRPQRKPEEIIPPPPPPPANVLKGTTWTGSETASDTTNLKFVFQENGDVFAYDDTRSTWSGTWRKTSDTTVIINLTSPNAVNYYGTIDGNRITGSAKRPGQNAGWRWEVTKR